MTPQKFIASLENASDVRKHWQQIESWQRESRVDALLETARSCAQAEPSAWQKSSIFDNIVSRLALERDAKNLSALLQIVQWQPHNIRFIAQMAAQNKKTSDLLAFLADFSLWPTHREFFAVLLQTLVLRHHDLRQTMAQQFWNEQIVGHHELDALPLSLHPSESKMRDLLPVYNGGGSSWSGGEEVFAKVGEGQAVEAETLESDVARLQSAVQNWYDESNGGGETAVFQLHRVLEVNDFGTRTLRNLPMESLRGAQGIALECVHFERALLELFNAACNGGAYNSGEGGAYGRLHAWQSLGALCDCEQEDIFSIAQVAERSAWYRFRAQGDWFYNFAWDVGLACLRPDGATLAVLCATDVD